MKMTELLPLRVYPFTFFNATALRRAKIVCNFGLSECNRVNWNKMSKCTKQGKFVCLNIKF